MEHPTRTLRGLPELRSFVRTNQTPVYFVSPSAFNLLGIDRWLPNFHYINYYDSFEGGHSRIFVPKERPPRDFESMEEINNYLLSHREVIDFIERHWRLPHDPGVEGETEKRAADLGLDVLHAPAELGRRLDSKIVTTRLGDEAGVPSAPNIVGRAGSYDELVALASSAGLGEDLVVQTAYGDSGAPRSSSAAARTGTATPRA